MNYNLIIIGGGPAGTGILFKALKDNSFDSLLDKGLAIVEKSCELMIGNLSKYHVNSDTLSSVFLECIEGDTVKKINAKSLNKEIEAIKSYEGRPIPLYCLKEYFTKLGQLLIAKIQAHPNCDVFLNTCVNEINQNNSKEFTITINNKLINGAHILIATGGSPSSKSNYKWSKDRIFSLDKYKAKMVHSDDLIKGELDQAIIETIKKDSTIVILGGGHSGFSSAHYLLNQISNLPVSDHAIKIYSNKPVKIFFNSKQEAMEHGYYDFNDNDFCTITQRLYRLAGLRMDGRTLYMNMLGLKNENMEKRAVLKLPTDDQDTFLEDIENATYIIQSLGYTFNILPVNTNEGRPVSFEGTKTGRWVNDLCQLLGPDNKPIENLYACGLAAGFLPSGSFGGEPSFEGQTNGIWYYQNIIAGIVLQQVI